MTQAQILFNGRWLRLQKRDKWEFVSRTNPGGAAVIVAVTPEDKVIFVEQFRVPIEKRTIEFPAGLIGDEAGREHESAHLTAARELEEESGWLPAHIEAVHGGPSSAGMSTEYMHFYRASKLTRTGPGGGLPGEEIVVHEVPFEHAAAFVAGKAAAGFAVDPKVYAGLYFLRFDVFGQPLAARWWV
jgi:ADP-ribose pyrophosphatase